VQIGVPDFPSPRSDICTVLVSATDGSSHNIYMIAGVGKFSTPYSPLATNWHSRNI
jgi:hypothetical protein